MTLTINYLSEGEYIKKGFKTLDAALDHAEIVAEMAGLRSTWNRDGTVTLHGTRRGDNRMFFGYIE